MKKGKFGLAYFIESSKSKLLWRYICRTCYQLPLVQRKEMLDWARYEFDHNRHIEDPDKIKYLTSQGTQQVHQIAKSLPIRPRSGAR